MSAENDEMRVWISDRVAKYAKISVNDVDPDVHVAEYGVDSVFLVTLCGELEDRYHIEIDPSIAWDYPTIHSLTGYLASDLAES